MLLAALTRRASAINLQAAHVWSFGVLLWELETRAVPFEELSPMETGLKVLRFFVYCFCVALLREFGNVMRTHLSVDRRRGTEALAAGRLLGAHGAFAAAVSGGGGGPMAALRPARADPREDVQCRSSCHAAEPLLVAAVVSLACAHVASALVAERAARAVAGARRREPVAHSTGAGVRCLRLTRTLAPTT